MKLCVLVTTMHQTDLSLYKKMNLQTDAVFANQCDRNEIIEQVIDGHRVKMVCTDTRGTSINRNLAMLHAFNADCVLFTDDDLIFKDGYAEAIEGEFEAHPEAEAIKFSIHSLSKGVRSPSSFSAFEKATRRRMASDGVCAVTVRQSVLKAHNLFYHECYGPGTERFCGEDTIFLMRMIDSGVKFFCSPIDIAGVSYEESSWFEGYTERYFLTIGSVIAECYPKLCYLIVLRSAYRFSKREGCSFSFGKLVKLYYQGIKNNKEK